MDETWTYYNLKNYFANFHTWPTRNGLRGFGAGIIFIINFSWGIYPLVVEIKENNIDTTQLLVHVDAILAALVFAIMNLIWVCRKDEIFDLIRKMSDFESFGVPDRVGYIEKVTIPLFKVIDWSTKIGLLCGVLFLRVSSPNEEISQNFYMWIPYYVPFSLKPWQMTLLLLFEAFSLIMMFSFYYGVGLLMCYTSELLTARFEHINKKISGINFKLGQKNCADLQCAIKYYLHTLSLFKQNLRLSYKLIISLRFFMMVSIALTAATFCLNMNAINASILIIDLCAFSLLYISAQRVTNAATYIIETIYDTNWYEADVSLQKTLMLFLYVSQREVSTDFGLFGKISHEGFMIELKKMSLWFQWVNKCIK